MILHFIWLSGFAFIVKTFYRVLRLSGKPFIVYRVPYPIVRVSYPIVRVPYASAAFSVQNTSFFICEKFQVPLISCKRNSLLYLFPILKNQVCRHIFFLTIIFSLTFQVSFSNQAVEYSCSKLFTSSKWHGLLCPCLKMWYVIR